MPATCAGNSTEAEGSTFTASPPPTPSSLVPGAPPRRNSIPNRKSVSFEDAPKVIPIESAKSFSTTEKGRVWFSRTELQRIRQQCYQTLDKMNSGQCIDESKGLCARGLEQYRRENMEVRTHIRRCANEAVFGMQKFQRYKGITLPDLLADLYESSSKMSLSIAHKNGLKDAALAASVSAARRALTCEV